MTQLSPAQAATSVTPPTGLSEEQVRQRRRDGQVNDVPPTSGRSIWDIIRANVFTRINAILAVLLAVVIYTGSIVNGAFGLLIIANSAVGVIQELRAKRTLDRLSIVGRAKPMVIRNGNSAVEIDRAEVVLDDLIEVGPGDQIVVDGVVRAGQEVAIDESSLTGESEPVVKAVGDSVYSGTSVVSGDATYQATRVGGASYAARLAAEASKFTLADSELFRGINTILRYLTWVLLPVGALVIYTQLFRSGSEFNEALLAMVASLVPMVPEGLVLMTTIAFALGVVRLGRHQVLVNELPAIEGLARVDIVCADKTGTLTENRMRLDELLILDAAAQRRDIEATLVDICRLDQRPNATARALLTSLPSPSEPHRRGVVTERSPFTSARKFAGLTYADGSTWILGAPEVIADMASPQLARAEELMKLGMRVLLLGQAHRAVVESAGGTPGVTPQLPVSEIRPVALIVMGQTVRSDAADTISYFKHEGVEVKVISGDNASAVGAVARELGMPGADQPVDARTLPANADGTVTAEFADIVEKRRVFGRVTAEHKRNMVRALRGRGHHVAMTGDGVNDVLALKEANLGVAMGDGAPATRSVAQLVLLNNRFAVMPTIVAEGRRVIGNIERVANLFLTKTFYSVVLALLVGIAGMEYPFEPIHVTVTGWFTIGIPAFVLSLAPNWERAREGFVGRVLRLAVPAGVTVGLLTFGFWRWVYPGAEASDALIGEASTATLIVLIVSAFWVLVVVARPYQWWKLLLLGCSAGAYLFIFSVPLVAEALYLYPVGAELLYPALAVGGLGALIIEALWWLRLRRPAPASFATLS